MPNHVTNILRAPAHVIQALLAEGEDGAILVDFGKIIPKPDDNDPIFTAEKSDYGNGMVGWSFDGYSPLDWAREHWGTKWNGYSATVSEDHTTVQFDTAWSHPRPVIKQLSKAFPNDLLDVRYADEDFGSNLGHYKMQNGDVVAILMSDEFSETQKNEFAADLLYAGATYAEVQAMWD